MFQKTKKLLSPSFGLLFLLGGLLLLLPPERARASTLAPETIITLTNDSREAAGLPLLKESRMLKEAAEAKAQDMLEKNYFSHNSPIGDQPWSWMKKVGYVYRYAGENLAINYSTADEQHEAWMNSETHKANILSPKYEEIGVAVVKGEINGELSILTVQMFGKQAFSNVSSAPLVAPPINSLPLESRVSGAEISTTKALASSDVLIPVFQSNNNYLGYVSLFLTLSLLFAPFAFLSRAYHLLWESRRKKNGARAIPSQALHLTFS